MLLTFLKMSSGGAVLKKPGKPETTRQTKKVNNATKPMEENDVTWSKGKKQQKPRRKQKRKPSRFAVARGLP